MIATDWRVAKMALQILAEQGLGLRMAEIESHETARVRALRAAMSR